MSPDELRAELPAWPDTFADMFRRVAVEWLTDGDATLAAGLVADVIADLLIPLEVAVDLDDTIAAVIARVLTAVYMLDIDPENDQQEVTDMPDNPKQPEPPPTREPRDPTVPAIYHLIQADRDREGEPFGGWAGERIAHDPNRPRHQYKPRSTFPPPPWDDRWTPGCDE